MKHFLKLALFAYLFSYLPEVKAEIIISCSHPEICKLAKVIIVENKLPGYQFKSLVTISGDPHEFEPTTTEIKNLIKAEFLIAGPPALNPWIKKVNYQRKKSATQKTLNLSLDKSDYASYTGASLEAFSHFWLYPKVYCSLKTKLESQFVSMKILSKISDKNLCLDEASKIEAEIHLSLLSMKLPVILTHDALLPLLETLSQNKAAVVAIKGSGHHSEATSKSVKKLYDALKAPRAVWIEEKGINITQNILSKKRMNDLTILIDTANSVESTNYFPTLYELSNKLKAIK